MDTKVKEQKLYEGNMEVHTWKEVINTVAICFQKLFLILNTKFVTTIDTASLLVLAEPETFGEDN